MIDKILSVARGEIGVREFPPGSNNVKYNTEYYGGKVSGGKFSWCCVFIWWVFRRAGLSDLYYSGGKTAYCPALLSHHRRQIVRSYTAGDIIFFNFSGGSSAQHVGICESCDNQYITTIDGNTGTGNDSNGGAVMRRKRSLKYVVGAYRPDYKELTQKVDKRYNTYEEIPEWGRKTVDRLIKSGRLNGKGAPRDKHGRPTDMDLSMDMLRVLVMLGE